MNTVKFVFHDGREVITPTDNIENFRRIFFHEISEIIYPDANGNFKATGKKVATGVDYSKAVEAFKSENEELAKENAILKEALDKINSTVDNTVEVAAKSKTKKSK